MIIDRVAVAAGAGVAARPGLGPQLLVRDAPGRADQVDAFAQHRRRVLVGLALAQGPVKQIKLTDKHIEGFIAAQKDMAAAFVGAALTMMVTAWVGTDRTVDAA